jgi:hypothetical protein
MQTPQDKAWFDRLGIGTQEPKSYVKPIEPAMDLDYIERAFVDDLDRFAADDIDHLKLAESFDMVTNA